MPMKVLNIVKFESPITDKESVIVTFRLMEAPEFRIRFYACQNCQVGFGGTTFPEGDEYVPDEIGEEMYIHSRLCSGVKQGVA